MTKKKSTDGYLVSVRHQDRYRHRPQNVPRGPADQGFANPAMAVGPHDDNVVAIVDCVVEYGVGDRIAGHWQVFQRYGQAMTREPGGESGPRSAQLLRGAADRQDCDLGARLEEWQGIVDRARGRPAAIPGDEHFFILSSALAM